MSAAPPAPVTAPPKLHFLPEQHTDFLVVSVDWKGVAAAVLLVAVVAAVVYVRRRGRSGRGRPGQPPRG